MNLTTDKFAQNLLLYRTRRGMTQEALAEACGIRNTHISHFEHGRRRPSLGNFVRLCNALNVEPRNLLKV
jgi:transcriptional regulator with XRE-family HTH domain